MGRVSPEGAGAVAFALIGAVAGVVVGLAGSEPAPEAAEPAPVADAGNQTLIPVYVSGWVTSPGVVWIPEGSLVAAAIEAAGGALAGAALDTINLASAVHDGDQVHVPAPGSTGSGGGVGDGLIDINVADETELQQLPGVGPVLASRIIEHREENGRFETIEDLLDVPGIGEARLESLRDLIRPP